MKLNSWCTGYLFSLQRVALVRHPWYPPDVYLPRNWFSTSCRTHVPPQLELLCRGKVRYDSEWAERGAATDGEPWKWRLWSFLIASVNKTRRRVITSTNTADNEAAQKHRHPATIFGVGDGPLRWNIKHPAVVAFWELAIETLMRVLKYPKRREHEETKAQVIILAYSKKTLKRKWSGMQWIVQ